MPSREGRRGKLALAQTLDTRNPFVPRSPTIHFSTTQRQDPVTTRFVERLPLFQVQAFDAAKVSQRMKVTLSASDGYASSAGLISPPSRVRERMTYARIAATRPTSVQSVHVHDGQNVPKMFSDGECISAAIAPATA
jgi:hypothetical protein